MQPNGNASFVAKPVLNSVIGSLVEKLGRSQTMKLAVVGSGAMFGGFTGDRTRSTEKLPDAYVKLRSARFFRVVCEAGCSDGRERLMNDTPLASTHRRPDPNFNSSSIHETVTKHPLQASNPATQDQVMSHGGPRKEEAVLHSVDHATNVNDLANNPMDLNLREKLRNLLQCSRPSWASRAGWVIKAGKRRQSWDGVLAGPSPAVAFSNLQATLEIYQESKDSQDVVQLFGAILLRQSVVEDRGVQEFELTMKDFSMTVPP
ncbi:hypothetical protein HOY82DRAFT_599530 [Tuber indicum]|nr:hypothetical protein HOY82DRAFT_599530 [Tuber indicum]